MISDIQKLFEDYCTKKRESLSLDKPETSIKIEQEPTSSTAYSSFTIPGYHDFRFQNQEPKEESKNEEDEGSEKFNRKRRINREQFISHYFTSGCKSKRIKTSSDSESQTASHTIPEPISDSPTYSRVVLFEHLDDLCVICCDTFRDDVTNLTLR